MKKFFIALVFSILSSAQIFAAGFDSGENFEAVILRGTVYMTCEENGRRDFGYVNCVDEALEPYNHVKFESRELVDADKVELTATWEDGTVREKSSSFDRETGKSTDHFNLWLSSLFQRPLLDHGKNVITFRLLKDDALVKSGNFDVIVHTGQERKCSAIGRYWSNNLSDCRFPSQHYCGRYFREENYCRGN